MHHAPTMTYIRTLSICNQSHTYSMYLQIFKYKMYGINFATFVLCEQIFVLN